MAEQKFSGVWYFKSSENFGDFMRASGVSEAMVQFGESTKPTITIKIDGKIFFYKSMYSPERGFQYECTYDEPFDQTTTDGRQVKTTITWNDDEIVQIQRREGFEAVVRRYLNSDGDLVMDMGVGGPKLATRIFSKQPTQM